MDVKHALPLLPLRDIVIFPSMVIPLFVGRDKSISSLNEVMKDNKKIILVTQKNSEVDDPKKTDVFTYGCESNILQLLKLPDGTVKVLVEGIKRVKIIDFKNDGNSDFRENIGKLCGLGGLGLICFITPSLCFSEREDNIYRVLWGDLGAMGRFGCYGYRA